jgi:hypothetical protein
MDEKLKACAMMDDVYELVVQDRVARQRIEDLHAKMDEVLNLLRPPHPPMLGKP